MRLQSVASCTLAAGNEPRHKCRNLCVRAHNSFARTAARAHIAQDNHTDHLLTALVGDGTVMPFIFQTKRRDILENVLETRHGHVVVVGREQPALTGYKEALHFWRSQKCLKRGDIIVSDNEAAFRNQEILDMLDGWGVECVFFPPRYGALMNPCDNSFHSAFQAHLSRLVLELHSCSSNTKVHAVWYAWDAVSEESVLHFFHHCGLVDDGKSSLDSIAEKLREEGIHPAPRHFELHQQCLNAYIAWRRRKHIAGDDTEPLMALEADNLDGHYWAAVQPGEHPRRQVRGTRKDE